MSIKELQGYKLIFFSRHFLFTFTFTFTFTSLYFALLQLLIHPIIYIHTIQLRPPGSMNKKRHLVWRNLEGLLENRSRTSIMRHAIRKLAPIAGLKFGWNEADKDRLMELVNISRSANSDLKWIEIGREMSRLADECKSCYERLQSKVNIDGGVPSSNQNGSVTLGASPTDVKRKFYTQEEDINILQSIRKNCQKKIKTLNEIPVKDLPWRAIAITFDNQGKSTSRSSSSSSNSSSGSSRTAKDLSRRWPSVRAKIQSSCGMEVTVSEAIEFLQQRRGPIEKLRKLLGQQSGEEGYRVFQHIKSLNVEDETEITWTEVDAKLCLPYNSSRRFFRSVRNDESTADLSYRDIVERGLHTYSAKKKQDEKRRREDGEEEEEGTVNIQEEKEQQQQQQQQQEHERRKKRNKKEKKAKRH